MRLFGRLRKLVSVPRLVVLFVTGIEPFPSCQNCQAILEGAKEIMP